MHEYHEGVRFPRPKVVAGHRTVHAAPTARGGERIRQQREPEVAGVAEGAPEARDESSYYRHVGSIRAGDGELRHI